MVMCSQLSGEATYVFDGTLTEQQRSNTKSKFEVGTSAKFDLGLDLKLFNKVSIVTDYFTDTRKDLLIPNIPVSGITEIAS
jgi:hypothetical protein